MKFLYSFLLLCIFEVESFAQFEPNSKVQNVTSTQLLTAYKQGTVIFSSYRYGMTPGGGNCASIALIKAAIGSYGLFNVFLNVTIDSIKSEFIVILRTGKTVNLNFDRYEMASKYFAYDKSRLPNDQTSKDILEYSKFCFAVMARVKQLSYSDPKRQESFYYVDVDDLNKGEPASKIYSLLGLPSFDIDISDEQNFQSNKHILVWNAQHAVYSYNGLYDEAFLDIGTKTGVEKLSILEKAHCSSSLCPVLGAYAVR